MPKRTDPIVNVVDFFETQPLPVVVSTLALCRRKVMDRVAQDQAALPAAQPTKKKKPSAPKKKKELDVPLPGMQPVVGG